MPLDATKIPAQVKQDAQAWRRNPTSEPDEMLRVFLVHVFDVEDAMFVRSHVRIAELRARAGKSPLTIKRLTFEHAALLVCCLLWDIDDEGRSPNDDELALASELVRLAWTPKPVDEVVNVPGAQERWDKRL